MRPVVLNVGCGPRERTIPALFDDYEELRMDVDATVEPDVLASLTATGLPDCSVDAVFASHVLEHVEQWDVPAALAEVLRVLRPGGQALLVTPDLVRVAQEIVERPGEIEMLTEAAPFGSAPLDMLFGYQPAVKAGQEAQRHRTAFTQQTLAAHLLAAGFASGQVTAHDWQLWAVAVKGVDDGEEGS